MAQCDVIERVFGYIDRNAEAFVEELRRVCRQPSVSAQKKGMDGCKDLVKGMMEELGFRTQEVTFEDGFPAIYGSLNLGPRAHRTLLLYNHYDVQPPEPLEEWSSEPFSADIREGRVYARGVADNKGNLVARMMAIRSLIESLGSIPLDLKLVCEGEEEIGSPHLREFVERRRPLLRADGCLWEGGKRDVEGRPEIYLGVKGILYVELRVRTAKADQHSMWAPILPNPAWRLTWALNTLKGRDERVAIEGFYDDVREPTAEDMELLRKVPFEEGRYREVFGVRGYVKGLSGLDLVKALYFDPTCTICGFDSGYKGAGVKTVNPCEGRAKIDFRLVPDQRADDIYLKLKGHLERHDFQDVEAVKLGSYEPARSPLNSEIVRSAIDTAEAAYGLPPIVTPMMPAAGPMSLFAKDLGMPTVGGECVARPESRLHSPDENIRVEDFIQGIKHVAATLISFGSKLP